MLALPSITPYLSAFSLAVPSSVEVPVGKNINWDWVSGFLKPVW